MQSLNINPSITTQRYVEISDQIRLIDYISSHRDDKTLDPEKSFMAVSSSGKVYLLNLTASIILDWISFGLDVQSLIPLMAELFNAHEEDIRQDVEETLADFSQKDFVVALS
jgi:hypothetical protein